MSQFRPLPFNILPPVIKNLMIINLIIYFIISTNITNELFGFDVIDDGALYFWRNDKFKIWQIVTHLFIHGSLMHVVGNMFTLWLFGSMLENRWGSKRFLNFYLLTGIGASIVYLLVKEIQFNWYASQIPADILNQFANIPAGNVPIDKTYLKSFMILYGSAIGASGATYGIKMAFALVFPNLMLFFPIPMKMKYYMFAWIIFEATSEILGTSEGISHIGHLSGILISYLIIQYWRKNNYLY